MLADRPVRVLLLALGLACLAVALPLTPALAEDQEPDPAADGSEEAAASETGTNEPERITERVTVTANREEIALYETPASVTVISSEELMATNPQNVTDLLNELPGVEITGTGAVGAVRGLPEIRGFSSNRVLILVDGQRLNNNRESTTRAGILPSLVDPSDVERIEVYKGSGAVLYGSDAMGGVINIITKTPSSREKDWSGYIGGRYSTVDNQSRGELGFGTSWSGGWFEMDAAFFNADDYESPEGPVTPSSSEGYDLSGTLGFHLSERSRLRFDADYRPLENVFLPLSTDVQETLSVLDPASFFRFLFPVYTRTKYGAAYQLQGAGFVKNFEANVYYQKVHKINEQTFSLVFFPGFGNFFQTITDTTVRSTGGNVKFSSLVGQRHALTYGLDAYKDRSEDLQSNVYVPAPFGDPNPPRDDSIKSVPDATAQGIGVYAQDRIALGAWEVIAALRYDDTRFKTTSLEDYLGPPLDTSDSAVTGQASVSYEVNEHWRPYVNVGSAFRAPNIQERTFEGPAPLGYVERNPELGNERTTTYEAGTKFRYGRVSGSVAAYYLDATDLIDSAFQRDDPALGEVYMLENVAKVTGYGGEAEVDYRPVDGVILYGNFSALNQEDDSTGETLEYTPPPKAVLSARWHPMGRNWWVALEGKFVARQTEVPDPEDEVPGYGVGAFRFGVTFGEVLDLQFGVENFTNKLFYEVGSLLYPAAGRNYIFGVRLHK
jgi:hemoglobin/transferrin/lactoferrin receptor protein